MKNDFKSLEVGDQVIVRRSLNPDTYATIDRLTKTRIILKNSDNKYSRETGILVGGSSWLIKYLIIADKEKIEALKSAQEKRKCVSFLTSYKWDTFDLEFLQEMIVLIGLKAKLCSQYCVHGKDKSEDCQPCGRELKWR